MTTGTDQRAMTSAEFRTMRELAGLTQADVAEWAGVADRSVRRWEAGRVAPLEVQDWVRACWLDVLGDAQDHHAEALGATRSTGLVVTLSRPLSWAGHDAAVTRLVFAWLSQRGYRVEVTS
jgi:hypothetical protein